MSIAITLSGGGFRATLFHIGVTRYLLDAGLLKDVRTIYAVSGGSILAAHLYANWSSYLHVEDGRQALAEVEAFTAQGIRGRILRRLLTPLALRSVLLRGSPPLRTILLESYLSKLYRGKILLRGQQEPRIELLATNLNRGTTASFFPGGFSPDALSAGASITCEVPLSTGVAASAAFPGFFPPIQVTHSLLGVDNEDLPQPQFLTDGGVFDNLALRRLRADIESGALDASRVILSDASGAFDWVSDRQWRGLVSTMLRANDIFMRRIADLEYEAAADLRDRADLITLRISDEIDQNNHFGGLSRRIQAELKRIRTDLDVFGADERAALIAHGYSIAAKSIGKSSQTSIPFFQSPSKSLERELERASELRLGWFDYRDWISWSQVLAFLVLLAISGSILYRELTDETRRLKRDLQKAVAQGESWAVSGAAPATNFPGFQVRTEVTTLDFGSWDPEPGLSKVVWTKSYYLQRSPIGPSDGEVTVRFATEGSAMFLRCLTCEHQTLPFRVGVYRSADLEGQAQATPRRVWVGFAGLPSLEPEQRFFLQLTADAFDGFIPKSPAQPVHIGVPSRSEPREVRILLLFPRELFPRVGKFAAERRLEGAIDIGGDAEPCPPEECSLEIDPTAPFVELLIQKTQPDMGYALFWTMPTD